MTHDPAAAANLTRRGLLAGLAAAPLAGCAGGADPGAPPSPVTTPDPLGHFRLRAGAAPKTWAEHLPHQVPPGGPVVLAISGGGEDGAFGAGALSGWSASGTRPDFDIVTGISTGALIAPFAFLGPAHDDALRAIYTHYGANDIMTLRPLQALFSDALYDTRQMADLIAKFTPPAFIQAVAARHADGGRLFVVTSDLDRARASIWDMGRVAQAGRGDLFRAIMRASAALPGLFPPVTLRYSDQGTTYTETHMDGGVHMQFLAIPQFAFAGPRRDLPGGALYLLINNTLDPAPQAVARSALSISQQALTTTIRANAEAAVNATRFFARTNGMKLSVASVDPKAGIVYDPSERFSKTYMNALYRHGYARGSSGTLWTVS